MKATINDEEMIRLLKRAMTTKKFVRLAEKKIEYAINREVRRLVRESMHETPYLDMIARYIIKIEKELRLAESYHDTRA